MGKSLSFSGLKMMINFYYQCCFLWLNMQSTLFIRVRTEPTPPVFFSVLHPFQDYFSSYETGQSVGGAKTGEPREKPPGTPASRTWLVSHVARAGLEPTPDTAVR